MLRILLTGLSVCSIGIEQLLKVVQPDHTEAHADVDRIRRKLDLTMASLILAPSRRRPMPRVTRWTALIGIAGMLGVAVLLVLSLSNVADFDPPDVTTRDVSFEQGGHVLQGTLYDASNDGPIALLVHGDAAQDRTSEGGYLPMVNTLTDAGISVFSWDKPGVGASTGDWLDQGMQDRAAEAVAALAALREMPGMEKRALGLIGFSQGGWVLPRVPGLTKDAAFLVLIGAAVSWQEQGAYYTTRRLEAEGQTPVMIAEVLQAQMARALISFAPEASYADYLEVEQQAGTPGSALMTEARFGFVQRNFAEDVRGLLPGLTLPVLVLSGADDLNVDGAQTVSVYSAALAGANPHNRFVLVPGATHSLLQAAHYNNQLPTQWTALAQARFLLSGRDAYAPEVLTTLTEWITTVSAPASP
jgi:pimeloyl-ACP methyl ester carboxylesterase